MLLPERSQHFAMCRVGEGEQDEDGGGGREGGEPKLTSEQEHRPAG